MADYRSQDGETLTLESDAGGVRTTCTLTQTHLAIAWQQDGSSGRTEHPLRDLSPEVAHYEGRGGDVETLRARAVIALSLAVVAYASVLREHVPLLAGWLLVFGLHSLWRAHRASRSTKWTAIRSRDGRDLVSIDHKGCDTQARERFVHALRERVGVDRRGPDRPSDLRD